MIFIFGEMVLAASFLSLKFIVSHVTNYLRYILDPRGIVLFLRLFSWMGIGTGR